METLLILCWVPGLGFLPAGVALLVAAVARSSQMSRDEEEK
ncbi:MAG: hypothetical protein RRC07_15005 [Anaerolineae bacterium]|nr:hypothetical protein [Anaerolineae bacterium]